MLMMAPRNRLCCVFSLFSQVFIVIHWVTAVNITARWLSAIASMVHVLIVRVEGDDGEFRPWHCIYVTAYMVNLVVCNLASYINVQWFRGGLVFKAHRLLYHSTLGLIVGEEERRRRRTWPRAEEVSRVASTVSGPPHKAFLGGITGIVFGAICQLLAQVS